MSRSHFNADSFRMFLTTLAFLVAPVAAFAKEIDCSIPKVKNACVECGDGRINCCLKPLPCKVINKLTDAVYATIQVAESGDGLNLDFIRTGTVKTGVDVVLTARFLPQIFDKPVKLKAHLSGADAEIAGLLYPVAYLRLGNGALDLLRAQGLDVEAKTSESVTCDQTYQHQPKICSHLAHELTERIASELEKQGSLENVEFRAGIQASSFGMCPNATVRESQAEPKQ